jgi:hypothetical protein
MSTNQSKDPAKFSNLGRLYREVEELRLQVRQAESAGEHHTASEWHRTKERFRDSS